jgi:obg-like ATPase 1
MEFPLYNTTTGAFDDTEVIHVDGEIDPVRDLETISEELRLKDQEYLVQNVEKLEKTVGRAGNDKTVKSEYVSSLLF